VTLVGSTESGSGSGSGSASGSGSDPSPQEGDTYSRRVSEIDIPATAEEDAKGNRREWKIKLHKILICIRQKKTFIIRKKVL